MRFLIGLLVLLAGSMLVGVIRKLRGGTFLPPPEADGDHHVKDRAGKWWRYNAEDGSLEQVTRKKDRT